MDDDDVTDEELQLITDIQNNGYGEGAEILRQYAANAVRQRAAGMQAAAALKQAAAEFTSEHADVLDDPVLAKRVEEAEQLLLRKGPPMTPQQRWEKALAYVRRNYGNADSMTIREMGRVRSLGIRGMTNPNRLPDDEGNERISREQLDDDAYQRHAHEGVVQLHGMRHGRYVEADPDYGRREVRRQREARVAERQQADSDLSQE
jgi:hypothetical protein